MEEKVTTRIELSKNARKDLDKVPEYIEVGLLAWIEAVENEGLEKVRKIPGYHDEPLKGERAGQRSIRLSGSYRAVYELSQNKECRIVEIKEVNKHDY